MPFFMMLALHKKNPFMSYFPFKFLRFLIYFLLEYMKTTRSSFLVLHVFKGEKCQSSNQEKMGGNLLLVLFLFTRPIILAKGIIWYNAISNFKNIFWKMPAIWDTLIITQGLLKKYSCFNYDMIYWFYLV